MPAGAASGMRLEIAWPIAASNARSAKAESSAITRASGKAPARSPIPSAKASARRSRRSATGTSGAPVPAAMAKASAASPRPSASKPASSFSRSSRPERNGEIACARSIAPVQSACCAMTITCPAAHYISSAGAWLCASWAMRFLGHALLRLCAPCAGARLLPSRAHKQRPWWPHRSQTEVRT